MDKPNTDNFTRTELAPVNPDELRQELGHLATSAIEPHLGGLRAAADTASEHSHKVPPHSTNYS